MAEGQRIQYNFVKPHQTLNGETLAKKVGLEVNRKNKWLDLLEQWRNTSVAKNSEKSIYVSIYSRHNRDR